MDDLPELGGDPLVIERDAHSARMEAEQAAAEKITRLRAHFKSVEDAAPPGNPFKPENAKAFLAEEVEHRQWLLGTALCAQYVTVIAAAGGVGKTSLLLLWALSLATGRPLIGMNVHRRTRVLLLTFEDCRKELLRRLKAAAKHHGVSPDELDGWLYVQSMNGSGITLSEVGNSGAMVETEAAEHLTATIRELQVGAVLADPWIKISGAPENDNVATDFVCRILSRISDRENVAVVIAHHFRKGTAIAGDIVSARGAVSLIDAARIAYTLLPMSPEEAQMFDIKEHARRRYVRLDDGKLNLTPADRARWFFLASVSLDNGSDYFPSGDSVQVVERWTPPDAFDGMSTHLLNRILDDIDAGMEDGERYSDWPRAVDRAAWKVVQHHAPEKSDAQCRNVIKAWKKTGLLVVEEYESPTRRAPAKGLAVDPEKRPRDVHVEL